MVGINLLREAGPSEVRWWDIDADKGFLRSTTSLIRHLGARKAPQWGGDRTPTALWLLKRAIDDQSPAGKQRPTTRSTMFAGGQKAMKDITERLSNAAKEETGSTKPS